MQTYDKTGQLNLELLPGQYQGVIWEVYIGASSFSAFNNKAHPHRAQYPRLFYRHHCHKEYYPCLLYRYCLILS